MHTSQQLYRDKEEQYYLFDREDMLPFVPAGIRHVLDVGCSSGGFGKLLKEKFGCEVWGVEPGNAAAEAGKHLDRVYQCFFDENIDFGEKKFDLIIFNDVLEHLADPWTTLRFASTLLAPSGRVMASIPNVQCYTVIKDLVMHGRFDYTSSGILDKTHLRFFTRKGILELFQSTGFGIERIEGMHSVDHCSRFLRLMKVIVPKKAEPFRYVSYGVLTSPIKL